MRLVEDLPCEIRIEDHFWIPMSDGVRLAGRLWRPRSAEREPVPAVLEYIPYRKRDLTAVRDSMHHPYIAGHGYACVRVDLRGTGDSEGANSRTPSRSWPGWPSSPGATATPR